MSEEITKDNELEQVSTEELAEVMDLASGKVAEAVHPDGMEMVEWAFTNDKTNAHIRQLFHMLYRAIFLNKIGVMHAKRRDSDKIDTLLVGVEVTPEGTLTWPLARVLSEEEQGQYVAPNGDGSWIE